MTDYATDQIYHEQEPVDIYPTDDKEKEADIDKINKHPARCSQCGELWDAPSCGPTHAMIKAEFIISELVQTAHKKEKEMTKKRTIPADEYAMLRNLESLTGSLLRLTSGDRQIKKSWLWTAMREQIKSLMRCRAEQGMVDGKREDA